MDPEERKYLGHEHIMVIMNHKYEIDWLMAWILSERMRMLGVRLYCHSLHWKDGRLMFDSNTCHILLLNILCHKNTKIDQLNECQFW